MKKFQYLATQSTKKCKIFLKKDLSTALELTERTEKWDYCEFLLSLQDMAKFWTDILVPLAITGAVAVQTLGVEISRASRLHAWFPGAVRDTLVQQDTLPPRDTLPPKDSLLDEEDFFLFEEEGPADTTPKIMARDTMKVPDSLKLTDPFRYQWYVALRDSLTHRIVVDSLMMAGDTILWPRIDSIYLADSTAFAKAAFDKWYAGLSKSERKRYDYEHVKLPAIMHRQDSIRHRKDSIKERRDSILESTPRILETAFLPDSMYYKRLVTWRHNRYNNKVETFEWDTTANYHFYDYPFMRKDVGATWLGMPGSAVQSYNFFNRDQDESTSFYAPYESWTYTPANLPFFNTKTPYTELEYYGNLFNSSTLSADSYRVFTTQNIFPSLNISLEMKRYGGAGTLQNEQTANKTYFVTGNYLGKKYLAHGGMIFNSMTRQESGGVQDNFWIRDTTVDVREITVNLAAATNRYNKRTFFLDQSYRIPFEFIEKLRHRGDSTWVPADTLNTDITTGFIGTSSEYTVYSKKYVDQTSSELSTFYNDVFNINPNKSTDSLRTMRLDNRIFVRLQPWREDAVVSKVEGGIGDRLQSFYYFAPGSFLKKQENVKWNTLYTYVGAEGRLKQYLEWDAMALYNFAGKEANDFSVKANAKINLYPFRRHPKSPISIGAHFETTLKEPDFYEQHLYTNHYNWDNEFGKKSTTRVEGSIAIPRWQLSASVGYALLANNIYYDTLGVARQNATPMSVLSAALRKDLIFGPVHLENSALFQVSSNPDVLPLPTLALNLRWFLQFVVVDPKTMIMQIGANTRYTTQWYAPAFNPVAGVFMNQKEELYGNCPVFDVFVNFQWKKVSLFLKLENAGNGWPADRHDYFTAHHYIQTPTTFKFGISWPFYPMLGKQKALSDRASSSGFGGSGLSGGGLSGALKGIGSGN